MKIHIFQGKRILYPLATLDCLSTPTWEIHMQLENHEQKSKHAVKRQPSQDRCCAKSYLLNYTSSHNHGSQKWVPPIVITFQIVRNFPLNHDYGRKSWTRKLPCRPSPVAPAAASPSTAIAVSSADFAAVAPPAAATARPRKHHKQSFEGHWSTDPPLGFGSP